MQTPGTAHLVAVVLGSVLCLSLPVQAGVDRWSTAGPEGARAMALAPSPENPAVLHVAVLGGGVFRSRDGGRTWRPAQRGLEEAPALQTLARDPADPSTLWTGGLAGGVLRSRDGGRRWHPFAAGLEGRSIKTLLPVTSASGTVLYAGTVDGRVWRRPPEADRWRSAGAPLGAPVFTLAVDPGDPSRLWAGTGHGLFTRTDGSDTWTETSSGLPSPFVKRLAPSPHRPDEIWAGTGAGPAVSRDGGRTWRGVSSGSSPSGDPPSRGVPPMETRGFVFDPADPARLWTHGDRGIYSSSDGGTTWRPVFEGLPQAEVNDLRRVGDRLVAALAGGGVWTSDDGGEHWVSRNAGLVGTGVNRLVPDPWLPETLWAGVRGLGVLRSDDGGTRWRSPGGSPGPEPVLALAVLPVEEARSRVVVAALAGRGVRRSLDGGRTWMGTTGLPAGPVVDFETVTETVTGTGTGSGPRLLAALPGSGVFVSRDRGGSWEPARAGLGDLTVRALAASPTVPGLVHAATDRGAVFGSRDGGSSWQRRDSGPRPPAGLRTLTVDPEDADGVYVGSATEGVFHSSDGGRSWQPVNEGLDCGPACRDIRLLAADPRAAGIVWAATGGGVFILRDDEGGWRRAAAGLPVRDALAVLPDHRVPGRVRAALNGRGVATVQLAGARPLRLHRGRFELRAAWRDPAAAGEGGALEPEALSGTGGVFSLPGLRSPELAFKLLDGRPVNGHFWLFGAPLTSRGWTVTVTDTETGRHHTVDRAPGRPAGVFDNRALGD